MNLIIISIRIKSTLIKRGSKLLGRKCLESALIAKSSAVNYRCTLLKAIGITHPASSGQAHP